MIKQPKRKSYKQQPYVYKFNLSIDGTSKQYIGYCIEEGAMPFEIREGYIPNNGDLNNLLMKGATITRGTVIKRFNNIEEGRNDAKEYAKGLREFMESVEDV